MLEVTTADQSDVSIPGSRNDMVRLLRSAHERFLASLDQEAAAKRKPEHEKAKSPKGRIVARRRVAARLGNMINGVAFLACNMVTLQMQHSAAIAERFLKASI